MLKLVLIFSRLVLFVSLSASSDISPIVFYGNIDIFTDYRQASECYFFKYAIDYFNASTSSHFRDMSSWSPSCSYKNTFDRADQSAHPISLTILLSDDIKDCATGKGSNKTHSFLQFFRRGRLILTKFILSGKRASILTLDYNMSRFAVYKALNFILGAVMENQRNILEENEFNFTSYLMKSSTFKRQSSGQLEEHSRKHHRIPLWVVILVGGVGIILLIGAVTHFVVQEHYNRKKYEAVKEKLKKESGNNAAVGATQSDSENPDKKENLRENEAQKVYRPSANNPVGPRQFEQYLDSFAAFLLKYQKESQSSDKHKKTKDSSVWSLGAKMNAEPERLDVALDDFNDIILPAVSQQNAPLNFGFHTIRRAYTNVIVETLCDGIEALGYTFDGSPIFSSVEKRVAIWLGKAFGLPSTFITSDGKGPDHGGGGIILESSLEAITTSIITARNKFMKANGEKPNDSTTKLHVAYASTEAQSSFEDACRLAGVQCRLIGTDKRLRLDPNRLAKQIQKDQQCGYKPYYVLITLGTPSTSAFDDIQEISKIAKWNSLWVHVDAATSGSFQICEENRYLLKGVDNADSISVDTTVGFVQTPISTFLWSQEIDLLKSSVSAARALVGKYNTMKFGCDEERTRLKALKAYAHMTLVGIKGYQKQIRRMSEMAALFRALIASDSRLALFGDNLLNLICVRFKGSDEGDSNAKTYRLCAYINKSGKMIVSYASPPGYSVIRLLVCHENAQKEIIQNAWGVLRSLIDAWQGEEKAGRVATDFECKHFAYKYDRRISGSPEKVLDQNADDLDTAISMVQGTQKTVSVPKGASDKVSDDALSDGESSPRNSESGGIDDSISFDETNYRTMSSGGQTLWSRKLKY